MSMTHDDVVTAFRERKGAKRNGNPFYQGHNMSYNADEETLWSYGQCIAKWWEGKPIILNLRGKTSVTTSKHIGMLWHVNNAIWVEPKSKIGYGYGGYTFPDPAYFDSCLRPGTPALPKIQFRKRQEEIGLPYWDECGKRYVHSDTYYVYGPWQVKKAGKHWQLWEGNTMHCQVKTLSECRKRIAAWEQVFKMSPWETIKWISTHADHPHFEQVITKRSDWIYA